MGKPDINDIIAIQRLNVNWYHLFLFLDENDIDYKVLAYEPDLSLMINNTNLLVRPHDSESRQVADMLLFDDDVYNDAIMSLLLNRFSDKKQWSVNVRPQRCVLKMSDYGECSEFLDNNHYIGGARAKHYIGIYYDQEMVGCMLFARPTRQSKDNWELVRISKNNLYKINGIWSYTFKWAIKNKLIDGVVTSFHDKRLYTGALYEKLGFSKIREIPKDYYWCRDGIRYHKSKLRKTAQERLGTKTEYELRTEEGYTRVWDIGKVKWSINIP